MLHAGPFQGWFSPANGSHAVSASIWHSRLAASIGRSGRASPYHSRSSVASPASSSHAVTASAGSSDNSSTGQMRATRAA
ncbi:hypothetical protein D9M70_536800 [compost metagenome]